MVSDAWRLTTGLVQINYTKQRQAKIANVNMDDVFMFSGSDIQGRNIRFEASSEIERRQDAQEAKAVEKAVAGVATAADVDEARRTPANALAKKMASDAIKAFIAGEDVDINVRDHSMPALREAIDREKSRALATGQREVFKDLVELEMLIRDQIETEQPADDATGAPAAGEQAPPTDTISQPLVQG
jgi:lipopolysaccharide biosynthesis protein